MKIKVCGITNNENLLRVLDLKPNYLGFIFHSLSPRDVTRKIDSLDLSAIPKETSKVAVFVNETYEVISNIVSTYGFDCVQLHGDESPELCHLLQKNGKVIKAFRVDKQLPLSINNYQEFCDFILLDSAGSNYGGNGIKFNHSLLNSYNGKLPFFLSGGIAPEDATQLKKIDHPQPHAVDINSKFEITQGIKDIGKLKTFFEKINQQ